MKSSTLAIIAVFINVQLNAQNVVKSEAFKIAFETTEVLEWYETESDSVVGYENDNYAVDIAVFPLSFESKEFISDLNYGARRTAELLGFEHISEGGTIPKVKAAHYVITEEFTDDLLTPVIVIAMINNDLQIAYEITVYCYNLNTIEGVRIAKSFSLLE